ncbi:hypothetical protein Cadr_000012077 [Camelus dromedarius]|uniref:Uncharacterized protein n=1 Tax=Camelus dromedarius TaxID=9838 RepID=A0A5N4DT15_CAMDR|nr:hypothetical protein Cadr_000012077 [Camelus dromedarius]
MWTEEAGHAEYSGKVVSGEKEEGMGGGHEVFRGLFILIAVETEGQEGDGIIQGKEGRNWNWDGNPRGGIRHPVLGARAWPLRLAAPSCAGLPSLTSREGCSPPSVHHSLLSRALAGKSLAVQKLPVSPDAGRLALGNRRCTLAGWASFSMPAPGAEGKPRGHRRPGDLGPVPPQLPEGPGQPPKSLGRICGEGSSKLPGGGGQEGGAPTKGNSDGWLCGERGAEWGPTDMAMTEEGGPGRTRTGLRRRHNFCLDPEEMEEQGCLWACQVVACARPERHRGFLRPLLRKHLCRLSPFPPGHSCTWSLHAACDPRPHCTAGQGRMGTLGLPPVFNVGAAGFASCSRSWMVPGLCWSLPHGVTVHAGARGQAGDRGQGGALESSEFRPSLRSFGARTRAWGDRHTSKQVVPRGQLRPIESSSSAFPCIALLENPVISTFKTDPELSTCHHLHCHQPGLSWTTRISLLTLQQPLNRPPHCHPYPGSPHTLARERDPSQSPYVCPLLRASPGSCLMQSRALTVTTRPLSPLFALTSPFFPGSLCSRHTSQPPGWSSYTPISLHPRAFALAGLCLECPSSPLPGMPFHKAPTLTPPNGARGPERKEVRGREAGGPQGCRKVCLAGSWGLRAGRVTGHPSRAVEGLSRGHHEAFVVVPGRMGRSRVIICRCPAQRGLGTQLLLVRLCTLKRNWSHSTKGTLLALGGRWCGPRISLSQMHSLTLEHPHFRLPFPSYPSLAAWRSWLSPTKGLGPELVLTASVDWNKGAGVRRERALSPQTQPAGAGPPRKGQPCFWQPLGTAPKKLPSLPYRGGPWSPGYPQGTRPGFLFSPASARGQGINLMPLQQWFSTRDDSPSPQGISGNIWRHVGAGGGALWHLRTGQPNPPTPGMIQAKSGHVAPGTRAHSALTPAQYRAANDHAATCPMPHLQAAQGPWGRVTPSTTCGLRTRLRASLSCAMGGRQVVLPWGPNTLVLAQTQGAFLAQVNTMQTASHQAGGNAQEAFSSSGRRDWPPPVPLPQCHLLTHLDAVLLQVQVPRVDGDAGWDLGQLSPCADHPAGLVAAGAGRGAGGGWRGAPSSGRCHGHAAPAGPQGWGEEPEEEQGPMGPGHPTRRQWGAQGAAGARHPQCSCSAWALGGCRRGGERGRGSLLPDNQAALPLLPALCPPRPMLRPLGGRAPEAPLWRERQPGRQRGGLALLGLRSFHLVLSSPGRLYAHFAEQKTESGGRGSACLRALGQQGEDDREGEGPGQEVGAGIWPGPASPKSLHHLRAPLVGDPASWTPLPHLSLPGVCAEAKFPQYPEHPSRSAQLPRLLSPVTLVQALWALLQQLEGLELNSKGGLKEGRCPTRQVPVGQEETGGNDGEEVAEGGLGWAGTRGGNGSWWARASSCCRMLGAPSLSSGMGVGSMRSGSPLSYFYRMRWIGDWAHGDSNNDNNSSGIQSKPLPCTRLCTCWSPLSLPGTVGGCCQDAQFTDEDTEVLGGKMACLKHGAGRVLAEGDCGPGFTPRAPHPPFHAASLVYTNAPTRTHARQLCSSTADPRGHGEPSAQTRTPAVVTEAPPHTVHSQTHGHRATCTLHKCVRVQKHTRILTPSYKTKTQRQRHRDRDGDGEMGVGSGEG